MDGNEAAANRAYPLTEIAAIYPITPSSPMASRTDSWSARGRKNMFGQTVRLIEMQSEAGAIGAVHGSIQTGALSTSFTSSQGLMLMIPVLYRIAGERQPAVLHVAARTVGTHGMSIFGDHSDVMACRQTGFAQFCSASVQEVSDLAPVAHLAAIESRIPFMHFFDGFRTSHEISKVEVFPEQMYLDMLDQDALKRFKDDALNPEHPTLRNTVINPDVYFQVRESNNRFYEELPDIVEKYLCMINEKTGRDYHLFNYYGDPDAEDVVILMGSVTGAAMEAVEYLQSQGRKAGLLQVHLYRPFSAEYFLKALPESVKRIAVLDRCKDMGSIGEPLFEDVCTAVLCGGKNIRVIGGRYGLSSKDTDPGQIVAVFDNLTQENPLNHFTIGITDDVTHLSLDIKHWERQDKSMVECKFWGLGGDGTVGANHNTVKIISDHTEKFGQAYFEYDAKKSFGITKSHLRFSDRPIRGSYYVKSADFVACHKESFMLQYDITGEIKPGGTLLLNTKWSAEELSQMLPAKARRDIAENGIHLYLIDATAIAQKLGLGSHTNTILQSAFFRLMPVIPIEEALGFMKQAARDTYFAKGDQVVEMNLAAIDAGAKGVVKVEIPADWAGAPDEGQPMDINLAIAAGRGRACPSECSGCAKDCIPDVVKNILIPVNRQKGDDLPVSAFAGYEDGHIDMGLTAYEKRGIAVTIPKWDAARCIQCNQCSFVCPHAVIRPYLLNDDEAKGAPAEFEMADAKGPKVQGMKFAIQVSTFDCTGCGSCASVCPVKALDMVPAQFDESQIDIWNYGLSLSDKGDLFDPYTVKGSQFRQPLVEFSAACAGCGETPYAKLLTQLFGERLYWANATGCSQAWGAPFPGIPYTTPKRGFGPAWTNSLFENNAELALGMALSVRQQRKKQKANVEEYIRLTNSPAAKEWLDCYEDPDASRKATDKLIQELEDILEAGKAGADGAEGKQSGTDSGILALASVILERKDRLAKKSFWMYGGDGWAYDIGYGGLDHVIASGEDINVFVIDTEVYSNTGGQSSKATPLGAVAEFASAGKRSKKKDLGALCRAYGTVYVAQVAMGASMPQLLKAIKEAEAHPGPSVIIAYTPCTSHGIKAGMANVQAEMKRAVDSGYWLLYRYDPKKEKPLTLDSKEPTLGYEEFLDGETRYNALRRTFPENAETLFAMADADAKKRYENYREQDTAGL